MFRSLLPLLLTVFIDSLGFGMIFPILSPLIMQADSPMLMGASLSVKGFVLGLIISAFCIGQFFGGPILGALSDRHGRKKVICWTLLIGAICYFLLSISIWLGSVVLFLISRIAIGMCSGNFPVAQSMIVDMSTEEQKRTNFGLIGMAWGVGFILGPYLGGRLADWGGMVTPFLAAALFCLLNLVLSWQLIRETLTERRRVEWTLLSGIRDIRRAFGHPELKGIFIVTFIFSLGWGFFLEFSGVFLMHRFSFGPVDIGNFYAYIGIWMVVCQGFVIRFLVNRFTPDRIMRWALFFLGMNLLFFLRVHSSWLLFILMPFITLPESLVAPTMATMVSSRCRKDEQGQMLGVHNSVQWSTAGLLPLFSGALVANYPLTPILFSSFLVFVSFAIFLFFFREKKESQTLEN